MLKNHDEGIGLYINYRTGVFKRLGVAKEYTVDGKTAICYRGKENFWGNIWKFVYGINIWSNGKMGAVSLTFAKTSIIQNLKIQTTMLAQVLLLLIKVDIFLQWDILHLAIGYS